MQRLEEIGLTEEEIKFIRYVCKSVGARSVTVEDVKK